MYSELRCCCCLVHKSSSLLQKQVFRLATSTLPLGTVVVDCTQGIADLNVPLVPGYTTTSAARYTCSCGATCLQKVELVSCVRIAEGDHLLRRWFCISSKSELGSLPSWKPLLCSSRNQQSRLELITEFGAVPYHSYSSY